MKSLKLLVLGLSLITISVSCKKTDHLDTTNVENVSNDLQVQTGNTSSIATAWKPNASWEVAKQKDFSVHFTTIKDVNITEAIADKGLVLVFKKNNAAITTLPAETKQASGSQYWYYQVNEGHIMIAADTYGSANVPSTSDEFSYVILTEAQLNELESKGKSRIDLLGIQYNELQSIK